MLQKLVKWISTGEYTVVKQYSDVFTEQVGSTTYNLKSVKVLQGNSDRKVRIELERRWGMSNSITEFYCYFQSPDEVRAHFYKLLRDVQAQVTEPDQPQKRGLFEKLVFSLSVGKIVRSYGRIDQHPKNAHRFRMSLFLAWDGQRYWMMLREGEGSEEWSQWPVGAARALYQVMADFSKSAPAQPA